MKANLNRLTILILLLAGLILSVSIAQGAPPIQTGGQVHVVQWGDTLYSLARRYGTTVAAIVQANNLADSNWIYAGQRLTIPTSETAFPPTAPDTTTYYTVQKGDTLYSIARRYGTTVNDMVAANNIYNPSFIYTGQRLVIPTEQLAGSPPTAAICYTVQKGDTLVSIALRHGTTVSAIALVNNLANPSFIWVGQCLVIHGVVVAPVASACPTAVPTPTVAAPTPTPSQPTVTPTPSESTPCFDTRFQRIEDTGGAIQEIRGYVYDLNEQPVINAVVEVYVKRHWEQFHRQRLTTGDGGFAFLNLGGSTNHEYILRIIGMPDGTPAYNTWEETYTFKFNTTHDRAVVLVYQIPFHADLCHLPDEVQ